MFKPVSAPRGSPRRQPRPNGQVPPACRDPHVPCRPRRRVRLPPIHRRLALLPREAGHATGGALLCIGALAAHPHLRALASLPSLLAYIRSPALADGPATQGAARIHCQTRGARYFGLPWPRLRHGRYDRPACPRFFARAVFPSPTEKSPRPEATLGCGLKEQMQVLVCLILQRPGGGRRWP